MIEFILGPSGSGKTTLIKDRILSDLERGRRVILLVPEQTAVYYESLISKASQDRGISQSELEILNFKRLCNRVFREYGGLSYRSVTAGARALLLWKALFSVSPYLTHYKHELENSLRFVPILLASVAEFKSYRITPEDLKNASEEARDEDPELAGKLSDLSLIYSAYQLSLENGCNDPLDDLTRLDNLLAHHNFFANTCVYVDSFNGFTPQELAIIDRIISGCEHLSVSLCMSRTDSIAFEPTEKTFKSLKKLIEKNSAEFIITQLDENKRHDPGALSFLQENLWKIGQKISYPEADDRVRTYIASDIYAEAEFVANDITRRLREGARYRDFAVIAGNIEDYKGVLDAVFSKFSLPCHLSRRINLRERPIFKLIISALAIKNNGWRSDDIIAYIKTGLTNITPDECDEIEAYAYKWNIFGSAWHSDYDWFLNPEGYSSDMSEQSYALLSSINNTRRKLVDPLLKLFDALDGGSTVKDICRSVYDFLISQEVDKRIAILCSPEELRLWNCLCDALDTLADTIGDQYADGVSFSNLFSLVVDQTNVGSLPATTDEITFGSAGRIKPEGVKHVYLIGVNEGVFPHTPSENGVFSDNDKATLEGYGLVLSPDTNDDSVSGLLSFYQASCSPTDSLCLTCFSRDSSGASIKSSIGFDRICALFPLNPLTVIESMPPEASVQNMAASLELSTVLEGTDEGEALRRIFSSDAALNGLFDDKRQKLITTSERLDTGTAEKLFGQNVYLTQSRLDAYVMCAFGYECNYSLKLKKNERYDFKPSDTGNLIHLILEKFFSRIRSQDGSLCDLSSEQIDAIIDEILDTYISSVFGIGKNNALSNRAAQLFRRLRRSVRVLINDLITEFSQSEFTPGFFEMKINSSGDENTVAPLKIPLPDGNFAYIHGVADRVDICKRGNDVYVRVVDYKTGGKDFSLYDISLGLNLQMLIYLFSIWKDGNGNFRKALGITGDIIPTGVIYYTAKPSEVTVEPESSKEQITSAVASTLKRKGLLINDEQILRMMEKKLEGKYIPVKIKRDGSLSCSLPLEDLEGFGRLMNDISSTVAKIAQNIKSGEASAIPLKDAKHDGCKYCPHKSICRNPAAFRSK